MPSTKSAILSSELPVQPAMTPGELAEYLSVELEDLREMRDEGSGPKFSDVSGLIRYERTDLAEWIAFRGQVTELIHDAVRLLPIPELATQLLESGEPREQALDRLITFVAEKMRSQS